MTKIVLQKIINLIWVQPKIKTIPLLEIDSKSMKE
jgi:hypothetical protein